MFYSQFILAKKGPLGTIWIAAHLERKLRKNQVADTDIGVSVDSILSPDVPIALRLSSHLLLGVVRIYNKKVNYLFDDCSETLLKVKQAFRSTAVDLPPEEAKAPYSSITLPETFDLDDFELPELFQGNFVDHHVSTKEQITLQDTMDGVVYTTSQFGLDERFGDGDASQIGLDLDEELLLNKGTSSGHGVLLNSRADSKISFESSSTQKGEGVDEEIPEAPEAVATNCSIEAPSTPGLVEGQNLPSNQEPFICDDYMEEDHEPTQSTAQDIFVSASTNVEDRIDQDVLQDNIFDTGNQKFDESRSQAGPASFTDPNDLLDSLNTADLSGSVQVIQASEGPDFECAQNEICSKTELNGALAVSEEVPVIGLDETIVSSTGQTELNGFCSVSENPSFVDKSLTEPLIDAQGKLLIDSFSEKEVAQNCIIPDPSEISVVDARVDSLHGSTPVLQPCTLHNNDENVEFNHTNVEFGVVSDHMSREDATDALVAKDQVGNTDLDLNEEQLPNAAFCSELNGQSDILKNVELPEINISTASELTSPEKMLSLPDEPVIQSNEFFVGTTPEKEVIVQEDQNTTLNNISGRKRSFTESTMTLQSLKSVESSEATQFKRTADSVPDDDDLLSSILVGRGSTILKVKSTPPASQLTSSKRPRNTRSTAIKRKMLLDDSTVLHGDIIRQQLLNTEDIRRVRKKAPSTPSEIWILQKQFLGSEIFIEPIFTGISAELNSLHRHPFDLRETKLVQDKESTEQSLKPAVGEETDFVGPSEQLVAEDENARQSAVCTSNQSIIKDSTDINGDALPNGRTSDVEVAHPSSLTFNNESIVVEDRTLEDSNADEHRPLDLERVDLDMEFGTQNHEHQTVHNDELLDTDMKFDDRVPLLDHEREDLDNQSSNPVGIALETENAEHEMLNNSEFLDFDLQNYERSLLDHEREDLNVENSNPVGEDLVTENAVLLEVVNQDDQFVESQIFADANAIDSDYPTHENLNDLEADGIEHDTDFLNFDDDDDENPQEDENSMPNAEGPQILDNSGWSTRTRAVANYLQVMFQKEAQHGRTGLHLDTILAKKTRKEASRMFFETLVLKTRDYIHVEQPMPFGNVGIKPRARLLKSDF